MKTVESQRDELAEIIERGEHYYDTGSHYELSATDAADAVLAAGYRKPRTIATVEELDALPEGSVVMGIDVDREQLVSAKQYAEWRQAGTDDGWQAHGLIDNYGELVVLWEPEA